MIWNPTRCQIWRARGRCWTILRYYGWKDGRYDRLIEKATHSSDRVERMALYREADHILVSEQVLIIPLLYSNRLFIDLYRPELETLAMDAMGNLQYKSLRIKQQSTTDPES